MILDRIERLSVYEGMIPGAAMIYDAFLADDEKLTPHEVRRKSYMTKSDAQRRFEVHDRTVDLMLMKSGCEVIHVCPEDRLERAEELPGDADGRKLNGGPRGSAVEVCEGMFIAIFPGEAHMVAGMVKGETGPAEKWVVKIGLS